MIKIVLACCALGLLVVGSYGYPTEDSQNVLAPLNIIKVPIRCPEGMRPDGTGKCRNVWGRSLDDFCPEGTEPDESEICGDIKPFSDKDDLECFEREDCGKIIQIDKREVQEQKDKEQTPKTESPQLNNKSKKMKLRKSGKKSRRMKGEDKQGRSHHAFIIMLKKKKKEMMKPKPPPPPPHPHPPPHHHHPEPEQPPEEEPPAEDEPAPEGLFFADKLCISGENQTDSCPPDAEMLEKVESNKEFKEWKPPKSSESSEYSDSSSSSVSESEGESVRISGESEDEILEKAIRVKLMKIFKMKQRYGPALRRWLVDRLREYEDSFGF